MASNDITLIFVLTLLARYITLHYIKIEIRSLFGQLICALFLQINGISIGPLYEAVILCDCIIKYIPELNIGRSIKELMFHFCTMLACYGNSKLLNLKK